MSAPTLARPADLRSDRCLLAAINRWRRSASAASPTRWEASWDGWWHTADRLTEVCWAPERVPDDVLEVVWRERRYGPERRATIPVTSVRQAVDVLVALGILPPRFASAYTAASSAGYVLTGFVRDQRGRPASIVTWRRGGAR